MALPSLRKDMKRSTVVLSVARAEGDVIQSRPGLFKFANFKRWVVVPSGSELIEDVRKATDDFLSINEPLREVRTAHAACLMPTHHHEYSVHSDQIHI